MKAYVPMTPEQLVRAEERLRHPERGSKMEAAKAFGIDLTLLIVNLRRTPAERAQQLQVHAEQLAAIRGLAQRRG